MKLENEFDPIRKWAKEKGILTQGDPKTQVIKLFEEVGELSKSILVNDHSEFSDAIGDCVVVLTNLAALKGFRIEDCINGAYSVIEKRKGVMQNGTFIKN
jgi:NTP pyrophosphatase (non-canonical NTP hydrolase)